MDSYYVGVKYKPGDFMFKSIPFKTEEEAKEVALGYIENNDFSYIEYGVENYDHWQGLQTIAVLKNEE